jgi:hypothetical protein
MDGLEVEHDSCDMAMFRPIVTGEAVFGVLPRDQSSLGGNLALRVLRNRMLDGLFDQVYEGQNMAKKATLPGEVELERVWRCCRHGYLVV